MEVIHNHHKANKKHKLVSIPDTNVVDMGKDEINRAKAHSKKSHIHNKEKNEINPIATSFGKRGFKKLFVNIQVVFHPLHPRRRVHSYSLFPNKAVGKGHEGSPRGEGEEGFGYGNTLSHKNFDRVVGHKGKGCVVQEFHRPRGKELKGNNKS